MGAWMRMGSSFRICWFGGKLGRGIVLYSRVKVKLKLKEALALLLDKEERTRRIIVSL